MSHTTAKEWQYATLPVLATPECQDVEICEAFTLVYVFHVLHHLHTNRNCYNTHFFHSHRTDMQLGRLCAAKLSLVCRSRYNGWRQIETFPIRKKKEQNRLSSLNYIRSLIRSFLVTYHTCSHVLRPLKTGRSGTFFPLKVLPTALLLFNSNLLVWSKLAGIGYIYMDIFIIYTFILSV